LASSSFQAEEKKTKKKTHKKKKMQKREGAFLQTPALPFHFWLPLLPPILPFCFKCFLASFSSQVEEKGEKKTHREEKKCRKRRELSFQFPFCPFTFGSCFCPFVSNIFSKHLFSF
jgi:hypothetical protein